MASQSWTDRHKRNTSYALPHHSAVTIPLSARRCVGCWQLLAQALLDVEPDALTHPCCDEIGGPIRWRH